MKKIKCLLCLLIGSMMIIPTVQAQAEKKKVVVLKKKIDEQGHASEMELEGDDAEEYIRDMNAEERAALETETVEERQVTINKNVEIDGATSVQTIRYDIVIKEVNGSIKKIKWEGNDEAEMPEEIREIIAAEDNNSQNGDEKKVDVEVDEQDGIQQVKITIREKGEERVMEFETENGEIPNDLKKELKASGIDPRIILGGLDGQDMNPNKKENIATESTQQNRSKGQLGVMIQDDEKGVLITDLVAGSSAQKGGLLPGDVITSVDGKKIKNTGALIKSVSDLYAGDEIEVGFLRLEREMTKRFELKKRTPRTWEEALRKN